MSGLWKSVIAFLVGVCFASGIIYWLKPEKENPMHWSEMSNEEITRSFQDLSTNQVVDFINWAESVNWDPATDVIPPYVANAGDIRKARAAVENQYLQFAGKKDSALVETVRKHPVAFLDYCRDSRAVNRFFIRN